MIEEDLKTQRDQLLAERDELSAQLEAYVVALFDMANERDEYKRHIELLIEVMT